VNSNNRYKNKSSNNNYVLNSDNKAGYDTEIKAAIGDPNP